MKRVTTKAQKIEAQIPMASVIPKPLTGPVPSQIRIEAVIRVVTLASTMVEVTLSKVPCSRIFDALAGTKFFAQTFKN
jgi:hypothetical protein